MTQLILWHKVVECRFLRTLFFILTMLFLQLLSLLVAPTQILGHKAYPERIAGADGTGASKCPFSGELPGRLVEILPKGLVQMRT